MAPRTKLTASIDAKNIEGGEMLHKCCFIGWVGYHQALACRPSVTLWFDDVSVREAWMPERAVGRGRPRQYSDVALLTCLRLKVLMYLPHRAIGVLMKSVMSLSGLHLPVPDHSILSRSGARLVSSGPRDVPAGPVHVVIDQAGPVILGKEAWNEYRRRMPWSRVYRPVRLIVDETRQCAVIIDLEHGERAMARASGPDPASARMAEYKAGKVEAVDADDVFSELEASLQ